MQTPPTLPATLIQPANWRARISELTGLDPSAILNFTKGWDGSRRKLVLWLVESAFVNGQRSNASVNTQLDAVLAVLSDYRDNGAPAVIKLLKEVDSVVGS